MAVLLIWVSCSNTFGTFTRNNPDSCVVSPEICGPNQACNQETALCETCAVNVHRAPCRADQVCNFVTETCEDRACSADGWCVEPSGTTEQLDAVWAVDARNVWIAGNKGLLLRWDGQGFTSSTLGGGVFLRALWGNDATDLWVTGHMGYIAHFDGATWTQTPSGGSANLNAVWSRGTVAWASGNPDAVLRWNGAGWSSVSHGLTGSVDGLWGSAENDVWLCDLNGSIHHFDGGTVEKSSALSPLEPCSEVGGTGPNDVWFGGSASGQLLHWDGVRMTQLNAGGPYPMDGMWGSGPQNVWMVGHQGGIRHWDGQSLRQVNSGTSLVLRAIHSADGREIWIVGYSGIILRYQPR